MSIVLFVVPLPRPNSDRAGIYNAPMCEPPTSERDAVLTTCRCGAAVKAVRLPRSGRLDGVLFRALTNCGPFAAGEPMRFCPQCQRRFPATWNAFLLALQRGWPGS